MRMTRTANISIAIALGTLAAFAAIAQEPSTPPAILDLLLKETPKPDYGAPVPAQISGRVLLHSDGSPSGLERVSVTDGYSVVRTDADGRYALTPDPKAVFVHITRPSGYDVEGTWYKPVAAEVDFTLKAARDETEYTFVHVTDTHIYHEPRSLEGLSRFVREVNSLMPQPLFVFNTGDLVNLSKTLSGTPEMGHAWFRNYVGIMNHLDMPHYNVAGDHTDSCYRLGDFPRGDIRCGKPMFWEYLGPHFFSFEYGKIHFVSVDFGYHLGKRQINGMEYPTNEVQPMHVGWMNQDMENRTDGSFIVTGSESDLVKYCPGFEEMARNHDVRLQLTGDDHVVAYKEKFVPYRTGGSLSGCWWNPKTNGLCPDLSPAGYLVYRVRGEEMECFYKGLGQRVSIVSHRVGAPWKGTVTVRAHVVQPEPDEMLEYSLNGGDWKAMSEIGGPFYRALYETTLDTASIPDGLVELRVRSSLAGETRSREFVAVNGATPAPAGSDASLTFAVGQASHGPQGPPTGKVNVIFNDAVVGVIEAGASRECAFSIPASSLMVANTLRFNFAKPCDGMGLTHPVLTRAGKTIEDPRDAAINQVKIGHWGADAVNWGGFIVGDGGLEEGPFRRRQDVFCFVIER
jgi:N terminal of Calcineurin-like phosphoesterase/Calcineurin-like phosphoesterase